MDVQNKLDEITAMVSGARAMPMSASCVVNRAELLSMLEELRAELPGSLAQAQELIGDREQMVAQARQEADRIIEGAHAERGSLIADTEVARRSQAEADRILAEARQEAEEVRAEADDYVDSKLANFEVVLTKTLGSVGRGREKLLGTGPGLDENGYEDEDAPERSHDPEILRRDADTYVDTKLGAFEAVLAKTLDAVGRGRQKLHGRIATDDLGALADDMTTVQHSSDADYLADLAGLADVPAPAFAEQQGQPQYGEQQPVAAQVPAQAMPEMPSQEPAYGYAPQQQPDPYAAYQQTYDGGQDPYGYQQQGADPYAYQYDGGQQAYDAQQGYAQPPQQPPHVPQAHPQALDETSLFDTSMISAEQLRAYEQGRGL
ncbi:cell division initiation protein [Streptomyces sp. CB09001]|uniref:cell division initiation protein n=1 Tax=Streptomyces sp. CB09001 TaxID=2083284 RepID=UPI000E21831C|nr:cell division initiation protein [Streptomyces sp. CB09001]AXL91177.1 cell division initiation protein [Streptomyces sp. CB09001]